MPKKVKRFELLANALGQDESSGVYTKSPKSAEYIQNLHVDSLGQWTTRNNGFTTLGAQRESGAQFDGLAWHRADAGTNYLIGAINGKLLSLNPTTGAIEATISTSLTAGVKPVFSSFKNLLFIAAESVALQKWTGSGSTSSAGGFPLVNGSETYDKPKLVERYYNRLAVANFNGTTAYPSHFAISNDLDPETYTLTSASAVNGVVSQVRPGDGEQIRALKTLYLPAAEEEVLVIFKDRSVYAFRGNSPAEYTVTKVKGNAGAIGKRAVVQVGNDLLFLDKNNIHSLTTATTSADLLTGAIGSERVRQTLSNLNASAGDAVWTVHLEKRQEVWFAIPTGSSTVADTIIVCYYKTDEEGNKVYAWSIKNALYETAAVQLDTSFYTGSSDGYLHKWFGESQYNEVGYNWIYRFPFTSFGVSTGLKRILELNVLFMQEEAHTISVTSEWALGGNNAKRTIATTIEVGGAGAVYGTSAPPAGAYGTATFSQKRRLRKARVPILGSGELLQLTIAGTSNATGVTFVGATGLVEYGAESRIYK